MIPASFPPTTTDTGLRCYFTPGVRVHYSPRASLRGLFRRVGVRADKIVVIRNAVDTERFAVPRAEYRDRLQGLFTEPRRWIVGAAGRLSPEKGFDVLVDAAAEVLAANPSAGFVLFGEGALGDRLASRIRETGLEGRFVLAGFRSDLDTYLSNLDLVVLPSFTEGLPNVVLEAFAAGVPVVANLRPVKGPDVLVEAARVLAASHDDVSFQIAGGGDEASVARLIRSAGLGDRVEIKGCVDDVASFLAGIDVAVLTSHSEGLSNAILEYMAAGRPIVATAVGGNVELIEDEVSGLLVPPGDPDSVPALLLRGELRRRDGGLFGQGRI